MNEAAGNGHLEVVKWLRERIKGCTERALWNAISNGHLEVAVWLCDNYCFDPDKFSIYGAWPAAANGHLASVKWLDEHFPASFNQHAMTKAAESGELDKVKWLHEHRREGCSDSTPFEAAENGHLDILQFLHTHYSDKFNPYVIHSAAQNGHLNVVRWLLENRSEANTAKAMDAAAGHLEVVFYLLEHCTEGFSNLAMETPQNMEVLCLFDDAKSGSAFSTADSDVEQLERLRVVFRQRPAFFRGYMRCLAEVAIGTSNVKVLDCVNQFEIELLSTTPARKAVARGDWKLLVVS
jgi:ankyrin repeat protein